MKKLVLSVVVAAFAVAVQAGNDGACADKAAAGGCCAAKQTSVKANTAECPMMAKQAKAGTCTATKNTKQASAKKPLKSPKAIADARR